METVLTSPEFVQGAIVFCVAFFVALIMVPASKRLAIVIGAIDFPSNRRINTKPVPRCGGIAMYTGFMAGALTIYLGSQYFSWTIVDYYVIEDLNYLVLIIGITLMFLTGLVDDIIQLSSKAKFVGMLLSCAVVAFSGVSIDMVRSFIDGSYVSLGVFDIPITVLYLLMFVNIINLIDGLDGLAAGIVGITSISMLILVSSRGSFSLVLICLMMIAICAAFLVFNFYPASIFMGDSGALTLGLLLGVISVVGVVRTQSLIVMAVPLVMAGVPILDSFSAVVRRTRQHKRFDQADMQHIHHRLVGAGYSQRTAVLILYACTAALSIVALLVMNTSGATRWIALAVLLVVMALVVWKFGLFRPVLQHYYVSRGQRGSRRPRTEEERQQILDKAIPVPEPGDSAGASADEAPASDKAAEE